MAVVPIAPNMVSFADLAVTPSRYAQIVTQDECSFWGVRPLSEYTGSACRTIWTLRQRLEMAYYLAEAEQEITDVIHFPLHSTYYTDERSPVRNPIPTQWGYVQEAGIEASTDLSLGETVDHADDPAVIGPIDVTGITFDDLNREVRVYHPDTDIEIEIGRISLVGANLSIEIPRCRMVTLANWDNPRTGLAYDDLSNFETEVDVKRVYTDPSVQGYIVGDHTCSPYCQESGCTDYSTSGCLKVRLGKEGSVGITPATYVEGTGWTAAVLTCVSPKWVDINYRAQGPLTPQAENAIVRLAHVKIPNEPCSCDTIGRIWRADREIPKSLTKERLNCKFGLQDGAWIAWNWAHSLAHGRMYSL